MVSALAPEYGFGIYIDKAFLIIKTAWGGKSLAVDFRPPTVGGSTRGFR